MRKQKLRELCPDVGLLVLIVSLLQRLADRESYLHSL